MDTIKLINKGDCKMIAHRGVSKLERENTAAAFVAAGNRSYFGVETDIYVTKDGKYAVNHDGNLKRVGGVDLPVEESTLAELRAVTQRQKPFHRNSSLHVKAEQHDVAVLHHVFFTFRTYQALFTRGG